MAWFVLNISTKAFFFKGMLPCTQNFQRNVSMQTNLSSANDSIFHYCMTDTYFWVQKLICVSKLALVSLLVNVTCHCFCACVMTRLVVQIILPLSTQFSYKLVRPFTQTLVSPKPALPWHCCIHTHLQSGPEVWCHHAAKGVTCLLWFL